MLARMKRLKIAIWRIASEVTGSTMWMRRSRGSSTPPVCIPKRGNPQ